jgi:hypothetical protein
VFDFYGMNANLSPGILAITGVLTSSRLIDASPPPTCLSTQVSRAQSIKRSASKVDKLAGVAMTSDPAGTFPSVLTAKSAFAASARAEVLNILQPGYPWTPKAYH